MPYWHSPDFTDFTEEHGWVSDVLYCFQWIDVYLMKRDAERYGSELRVLREIRDSDNTHAKNFTHPAEPFNCRASRFSESQMDAKSRK